MEMNYAIYFGNYIFQGSPKVCFTNYLNNFSCDVMQAAYEKILANKDAEESKISLRTIKNITKLFANFAKYGYLFRIIL